jgi:hypothetical protein
VTFDLANALSSIVPGRPLVITDADGVLLCFTGGLERWLRERGLRLQLTSYQLRGSIRRMDDGSPILDVESMALLEEFRADLDSLEAVDGACEALAELAKVANVVVLSNVNPGQAAARLRNFATLGIDYPLIANDVGHGFMSGKGDAVKALSRRAAAKTFFIDDIPANLIAVGEAAPDVALIHLVESDTLRRLLGSDFPAHCYAENWTAAKAFILEQLE